MAQLEIRLLGGFEVRMNGTAVPIPGRKERALLALLAAPPRTAVSRERLCGLLWGDRSDKQAHDSLKQALHRLRTAFDRASPIPIRADRISVVLEIEADKVDASSFERRLEAGSGADLLEAVALYGGEFLGDLQVPEQGFEDWLGAERQRLRLLATNAITALLDESLVKAAWDRAESLALKLLDIDPLLEPAHRALMRSFAARGRTAEALAQYRRCTDRLRAELGIEPEAPTRRLHRSIRLQRDGIPASPPVAGGGTGGGRSNCFVARELTRHANALSWDDQKSAAFARQALERAIRLDPGYARPKSLLAVILARAWRDSVSDCRADLDRAHASAQRAFELGADESTAFTTLAYIHLERRDFRDVGRFLERGRDLDPADPWIQIDLGYLCSYTGRAAEACSRLESARQLDPGLGPPWYWRSLGLANFVERRYEAALGCFDLADFDHAGLDPATGRAPGYARLVAAACCARLGDRARARRIIDRILPGQPRTVGRARRRSHPGAAASDRVARAAANQ